MDLFPFKFKFTERYMKQLQRIKNMY